MKPKIFTMAFLKVYPLYVAKAEKKGGARKRLMKLSDGLLDILRKNFFIT